MKQREREREQANWCCITIQIALHDLFTAAAAAEYESVVDTRQIALRCLSAASDADAVKCQRRIECDAIFVSLPFPIFLFLPSLSLVKFASVILCHQFAVYNSPPNLDLDGGKFDLAALVLARLLAF